MSKANLSLVKRFYKTSTFKWNPTRSKAAILLAEGYTQQYVADEVGKTKRTITTWVGEVEFSAEVDRLSVMLGIASRAERLRVARRVIRQKTQDEHAETEKDLLDWLKYVQSETDGVKLDIAALYAAFRTDDSSVAESGLGRDRTAKVG